MIAYLIKNNLKLMLRNKWMIGIMILGPIITIAALTSAFNNMMKSYEGVDEFTVGYSISKESVFYDFIEQMKQVTTEHGITLTEYPLSDVKKTVKENNISSFVEFQKDTYTIYKVNGHEIEGMTTEYFLNQFTTKLGNTSQSDPDTIDITAIKLDSIPTVESKDYYGIIYIVYFIWCCFVCLSSVVSSEMKHGIENKFKVSGVSVVGLYLSKAIPCILATICEMSISVFVVTWLYKISWGNIPNTILILFLTVVAATTFGLLLYYLVRNLTIVIVVNFCIVWIAGFLGGSFETYMFSAWSENIKRLSPIYHVNRTLVEYSVMGSSDYTSSCILYLTAIIGACMAAGIFIMKLRKWGRA